MSAHPHVLDARLQSILAELRRGLEALYGDRLAHLVLYGSQARGEAQPDSDIDVLIVLKGALNLYAEINRTSHLTCDISLAHDVVVSCLFMEEQDYQSREGPLPCNIHREGISV